MSRKRTQKMQVLKRKKYFYMNVKDLKEQANFDQIW